MTIKDAVELTEALLIYHNLLNWICIAVNEDDRYGSCCYQNKIITLSKNVLSECSDEKIRDTILHEISHALIGPYHDHNYIWYEKARELGCSETEKFYLDLWETRNKKNLIEQ